MKHDLERAKDALREAEFRLAKVEFAMQAPSAIYVKTMESPREPPPYWVSWAENLADSVAAAVGSKTLEGVESIARHVVREEIARGLQRGLNYMPTDAQLRAIGTEAVHRWSSKSWCQQCNVDSWLDSSVKRMRDAARKAARCG